MNSPSRTRYLRRRNLFRTVFGVFSLSGIMFAFQACYGTPQDFGQDFLIQGTITSASTHLPIPGIKILIQESGQYAVSASDGTYAVYCEKFTQFTVKFSDIDGTKNGTYIERDTTVIRPEGSEKLIINTELE